MPAYFLILWTSTAFLDQPTLPPPQPLPDAPAVAEVVTYGPAECSLCCRKSHWESTCDMPPHYPYAPVYHGYWAFKPYNYTSILRQQHTGASWGLLPFAPYAPGALEKLYADRGADLVKPAPSPVPPRGEQLPRLIDLLQK